ncbi:hypothetical protein BKI52_09715 [marine bacterium AO1-C]|nr:hypothetical protein BKI52_09715 [marine bacterium AO1-C]
MFYLIGANMTYGEFKGTNNTLLGPLSVGLVFNVALFYSNSLWLFVKYFRRNHWYQYILYAFLLHVGFIAIESMIDYGLIRYYYPKKIIDADTLLFNILLLEGLGNSIILIASIAYAAIRDWIRNERSKRQLLEEKLKTELAFLRTQINPHFLFNCLNNLYSLALQEKIQETAEGISKLSMLMRYTLHESSGDKVQLKKELDYIEDYLALQHLRIADEDDIYIKFDVQGEVTQQEVAPMLFIPFIENAFKHGLSLKSKTLIKILLKITDSQLFFEVCNTINHTKKSLDEASGLGLANVKRRLELIYPQQYQLDIQQASNEYQVALKINL